MVTKVVVSLIGGVVSEVTANKENVKVFVVDYDSPVESIPESTLFSEDAADGEEQLSYDVTEQPVALDADYTDLVDLHLSLKAKFEEALEAESD